MLKVGTKVMVGKHGLNSVKAARGLTAIIIGESFGAYKLRFDRPVESDYGAIDYEWFAEPNMVTLIEPKDGRHKSPMNQKILKHLTKGKSLTQLEALSLFGCFRLAAAVHDLRNAGHDIQTETKTDENGKHYARYRFVPPVAKAA